MNIINFNKKRKLSTVDYHVFEISQTVQKMLEEKLTKIDYKTVFMSSLSIVMIYTKQYIYLLPKEEQNNFIDSVSDIMLKNLAELEDIKKPR